MRRHNRTTDVIRQHWDGRAETFDDEAGHGLVSEEQRRVWQELLSRFVDRTPARVLDVGCGTGFLALRFAELGHDVTGVDLAPHMIEQARRKVDGDSLRVEFRVGNAIDLDLPDETYDVVVARHVIWNLPDPARGVAEWLRVLRPGGRLALIEGKWADNDTLYLSHHHRIVSRLKDAAALVLRSKRANRQYARIELDLPFSGGPSAAHLASFLEDHSVQDVAVESLMDPALWGEPVEFPRYLATGTRAT